jgi:hypothetical protein
LFVDQSGINHNIFSFLEFGSEEVAYDEDEGETSTYYLPGTYEGRRSSKPVQKKHKHRMKFTHRSNEIGADMPYAHYSTGAHPSTLFGNRPANLNVGMITKRTRTASRQRVVSPFSVVAGTVQALAKIDAASSGDTNSFQDDQSTLHGGSQLQKSMEVESVGDFEKQLPYDCGETSVKPKKKKPKNMVIKIYIHVTKSTYFFLRCGYFFYLIYFRKLYFCCGCLTITIVSTGFCI